MPAEPAPPPLYSQHQERGNDPDTPTVQILITPAADRTSFQNGYLGAEGERAAIEGEIHLKGVQPGQWKKVSVTLRTTEIAYGRHIELVSSEVDLSQHILVSDASQAPIPFAIPLMADVPQCIHTPQSALLHVLIATLHPVDPSSPVVSKEVVVHTRRSTSHTHTVEILPETHILDEPVRVEVEIPRSTFVVGEPIPVYITVPPPNSELVLEEGLRLRNVKVELVRLVEVSSADSETVVPAAVERSDDLASPQDPLDGPSFAVFFPQEKPRSASLSTPEALCCRTVLSRSGASCRFHSSKAVQLRFILYQPSPSLSLLDDPPSSRPTAYGYPESDSQCISITQATLLHNVTFQLNVQISFVDTGNRTERLFMLSIPIVIIPSPAPLPEVEEWVDAAYQKKHDRPPVRTVRQEETEPSAPVYQDGRAGPSYTQSGEPPPFEDRDIPPPPFFASVPSTSNHLPTFQESENEIYIAASMEENFTPLPEPLVIIGEGILFGFPASQQFDGHSDPLRQPSPPPPVEEAAQDAEVTDLIDIVQPHRTLGLMLERPDNPSESGELPPPPPLLDDPSDPPPSIDSEFRLLTTHGTIQVHPSPAVTHHPYTQLHDHNDSLSPQQEMLQQSSTDTHAPPPYLTPNDHEQVATPPPYVDFIPSARATH
ncbi:hypothetical protein ID866_612 [Astraeus odoratus]|nr:hypothetical protein ID866_612 [Astraeus odoratus]